MWWCLGTWKNETMATDGYCTRYPKTNEQVHTDLPTKTLRRLGILAASFPGWCHLRNIYPGRLTWNLNMMVWKMIFLFNWVIFRFHVDLPGCLFFFRCELFPFVFPGFWIDPLFGRRFREGMVPPAECIFFVEHNPQQKKHHWFQGWSNIPMSCVFWYKS